MRLLTLIGGLSLVIGIAGAHAQTQQMPTITVPVGQVLEVGLDSGVPQPIYSWILTRDREFITAQRDAFFQTRPSVPGQYTLDVSIQDQGKTRSEHVSFVLNVVDQQPPRAMPEPEGNGNVTPVIDVTPQPDSARTITLPLEGGIVMIDMSKSIGNITRYGIDFHGTRDGDGDGDPQNDIDNAGTLSERSGTAVYYLMKPTTGARIIAAHLRDESGSVTQNAYNVVFSANAIVAPPASSQGTNVRFETVINGLTVMPNLKLEPTMINPAIALVEWDFGDRSRSLLARPTHTYAAPGIYTIRVTVRNITTGETMFSGEETVQAEGPAVEQPVEEPTEPSDEPSTGSSGLVAMLSLIGGVLLILGLAIGAFLLLRRLKGKATGSLQEQLEKMEGKLFKQEEAPVKQNVIDVEPAGNGQGDAHLTLRREVPDAPEEPSVQVRDETPRTEFKRGEAPEVPLQDAGPTPDWLKGGVQTTQAATPAPAPVAPPQGQVDGTQAPISAPAATQPEATTATQSQTSVNAETQPQTAAVEPTVTDAQTADTPSQAVDAEAEERERERKRRKRQRYRENKKQRELAEKEAEKTAPIVAVTPPAEGKVDVTVEVKTTPKDQPDAPKETLDAEQADEATSPEETAASDEPIATIRVESLSNDKPKQ